MLFLLGLTVLFWNWILCLELNLISDYPCNIGFYIKLYEKNNREISVFSFSYQLPLDLFIHYDGMLFWSVFLLYTFKKQK